MLESKSFKRTDWLSYLITFLNRGLFSAGFLLTALGGGWLLVTHAYEPYEHFLIGHDLRAILQAPKQVPYLSCLALGFLCLVSLQLVKILIATHQFYQEKDWRYLIISLSVASLVLLGLLQI